MYSARNLALLLAASIAIVTAIFVSQVGDVQVVIIAGAVSFITSFLLVFIFIQRLFFNEINRIHQMMGKQGKITRFGEDKSTQLNPLSKINEEMQTFIELKQKEIEELKKLETFRKEFVADVSHELKTPIFAAQGFVHTLLDGAVDDKNVRNKFLQKAARSLDGLDALVQDLLTLSQIETGDI